jgi:DNA polymerase-3 subunit delta
MILKSFNLKKYLIKSNTNIFLLYGENTGLIDQTIKDVFLPIFPKSVSNYDESEILRDIENFKSVLFNKSFFEDEKLIIINRGTDKILSIIEELIEKKTQDIKVIIKSNFLEKKSRLRKFFEKDENTVIVAYYEDSYQTLYQLVQNFFKEKKLSISSENINLIIDRSKTNRNNIRTELEKILIFSKNKTTVQTKDLVKLINLSENHDISELVDQCLSKNKKKTINILNENNLNTDENILILRSFLNKLKRLKKLKINLEENKNIEQVLSSFRPQIFWKDKDVIKQQLNNMSLGEINYLIKKINKLELEIKKNFLLSNQIMTNFILENLDRTNSAI